MKPTYNRHKRVFLVVALLSVAGSLTVHSGSMFLHGEALPSARGEAVAYRLDDFPSGAAQGASRSSEDSPREAAPVVLDLSSFDQRVAVRLQRRIANRFGFLLSFPAVLSGLREQRELLARSVTVTFDAQDGRDIPAWNASVQSAPHWMAVEVSPLQLTSSLSRERIAEDLRTNPPAGIRYPVDAALIAVEEDEDGILRARTEGVAKTGDDFHPEAVAGFLLSAMGQSQTGVTLRLSTKPGRLINLSGTDLGNLELISSGRSDFAGSGVGRKNNVRKGIANYLHNAVVGADGDFSMNRVLANAPLNEWDMALGIFDGGELRPVPGGGLCQVATTLYRAALNGGLPVLSRANHSLYVHYYEKYGVGIDATIFPGKQDLTFRNDTGHPLLIQAYTEGDEAYVNIYGTSDGRVANLRGPYFSTNAPADVTVNGRPLRYNEIAWVQTVRFSDGREENNTVVSRYKSIPRTVVATYLHAAAGSDASVD